jgi:DNA-directed RNA polymerase I, II, and III subunit RPABC1
VYAHTQTQKQVLVWYYAQEKMNIDSIKEFVYYLESKKIQHGIIIYQTTITSSTKKVIDNLFQFCIEIFELKELVYDITQFKYYCHHECVSPSESLEIKKKFGHSLPSLLKSDPVVRYYGFSKGDIIRIFRKNNTIAYRIVR